MKRVLVLIALCLWSTETYSFDKLSKMDIACEALVEASYLADWSTTLDVLNHKDEGAYCLNPFQGGHDPDRGKINTWFIASMVLHPVITYVIPADLRRPFQVVTIAWNVGWANHNLHAGFRYSF